MILSAWKSGGKGKECGWNTANIKYLLKNAANKNYTTNCTCSDNTHRFLQIPSLLLILQTSGESQTFCFTSMWKKWDARVGRLLPFFLLLATCKTELVSSFQCLCLSLSPFVLSIYLWGLVGGYLGVVFWVFFFGVFCNLYLAFYLNLQLLRDTDWVGILA